MTEKIDNLFDVEFAEEYGIEKIVSYFEHWIKKCFENNVQKSGIVGWEFRTRDDMYQVVCEFRKNDDTNWWVEDD